MKKYTCSGQGAGKRLKGYASGGVVGGGMGGGGGAGGGGWSDEGAYRSKYSDPPAMRGEPMKASPLGGRMGERTPKYNDDEMTASKRR